MRKRYSHSTPLSWWVFFKIKTMKKETKERIRQSILANERRKYPNMSLHLFPPPKVQENSANALTRTIIEFLKAEGWQAERINTTGRYVQGKTITNVLGGKQQLPGKWIKGSGTKGSADISATINGRSVKIEVKYGRDKQSDNQKQYQADVERAGGVYLIARDLDGFLEDYDKLLEL